MNQQGPERSAESLRWLSNDYAVLHRKARTQVFDVVVVGSGYGGAMAAAEFAGLRKPDGQAVSVCVLERGKEYAPGMFPSSLQELPPHVRIHQQGDHKTMGRLNALLDVRIGRDVCAVVGNGLGGTSLINAGVMVAPQLQPGQFPQPLMDALTPKYFAEVKKMLGATNALHEAHPDLKGRPLRKTEELRRVGRRNGVPYEDAAITVQIEPGDPHVPQCTLCGDCMTGCNVGAKKSLDTTLLARAWGKGAEIYTGVSVIRVRRAGNGVWLVQTTFTDESMRKRHRPKAIRARKVVLAAGTLGSTEILFRSRSRDLRLSRMLGKQFSCNGDNLLAVHEGPNEVHSSGNEWERLDERHVGPTITGILRGQGFMLQEFAVPAALKRLFEECVTTSRLLHGLSEFPWATPSQKQQGLDTAAVDPVAMEKTLLVGLIGHDDARWKLLRQRRPRRQRSRLLVEGQLRIARNDPERRGRNRDPNAPQVPQMQRDYQAARAILQQASPRAGVVPNPLWKPLPDGLMNLMPGARGPVLTVHPLGGCPMGTSPVNGVVDHLGRVFRAAGNAAGPEVHEGLMVLDGAVVPGSLAANPALTIAAIARHAATTLATAWDWSSSGAAVKIPVRRPVFRPVDACTPRKPTPTLVELIERLAGPVGPYWVELTVAFEKTSVAALANARSRLLKVNREASSIRVYPGGPNVRTDYLLMKEDERDDAALFKARLQGTLTIVEPDVGLSTAVGAFLAWCRNRGLREFADQVTYRVNRLLRRPIDEVPASVDWIRFPESAARAGQQRCFEYRLAVCDVDAAVRQDGAPAPTAWASAELRGTKKITYSVKCNPWRQLIELTLTGFPQVDAPSVLKLDGRFLAGRGVPLLGIQQQQNQVLALADFAALGLAWARMLLSVHLWSFRAPDKLPQRSPEIEPGHRMKDSVLLPGRIAGLPAPHRHWLPLQPYRKVEALLTQYPHPGAKKPPIVLIHGYSASGNTYTHPAIPMPLARYLWEDGREVWVLDLRTSCGLATARQHWAFEDVAFADIPVAIDFVARHTGQQVDVFAHCIGAVMLGMALLTDTAALQAFKHVDVKPGQPRPKRWDDELRRLPCHIRRIVLSQKGPLLVYSDANVLRAYFMRLLRKFLLPANYQFHANARTDGARHNLMDRLLSTMVYPDDEFERENPFSWSKRARWAGFRHRMDALYARDFSLANLSDRTLDRIDELFGPLNLDTVSQAIHFARKNVITDERGLPFDATRPALAARWPKGGTLGIHGVDNGLADVKSLEVLQSAMQFANVPFEAFPIESRGHQDCLIGQDAAAKVFPEVTRFLNAPALPVAVPAQFDCAEAVAVRAARLGMPAQMAASIASAVAAAGSASPMPAPAPEAQPVDAVHRSDAS
jgi:cholesterol oxidase